MQDSNTDGVREPRLVSIKTLGRETGLNEWRLRRLADAGAIPSSRTSGGHRRFDVAAVRKALGTLRKVPLPTETDQLGPAKWESTEALAGLRENEVWDRIAASLELDTRNPSIHVGEYAFSEMLNNAIDHSGGTFASMRVWHESDVFAFEVRDDGIGAFERFRSETSLPSEFDALREIAKGKATTNPAEHTGQGIFFTSKALDFFDLAANGVRWTVDNVLADQTVTTIQPEPGTRVFGQLDLTRPHDLSEVFARHSIDHDFAKTRVSVKLAESGTQFVSRSEAKVLMEGLDRFSEVELDFAGVEAVGQGFVDEVLRVWPSRHPGVGVTWTSANEAVRFMLERGLG